MPRLSQLLDSGWQVTRGDPADPEARWIPVAQVPTVVHQDLMALPEGHPDRLADPFENLNELDAAWVAEACWTYRCRFAAPVGKQGRRSELVFKGLDTVVTVELNGTILLEADNMFLQHRLDVTQLLSPDRKEENTLLLRFAPARLVGQQRVRQHEERLRQQQLQHPDRRPFAYHVHQTEIGRAAVRKAQYHWGWDWGPILMTAGPWQPVFLETYDARIEQLSLAYELSDDLAGLTVRVTVALAGDCPEGSTVVVRLREEGAANETETAPSALPQESTLAASAQATTHTLHLSRPRLWWPRGYGAQSMYTLEAELRCPGGLDGTASSVLDRASKTTGFRRAELVQEPDADGTSFYFRINNVDVFAGGACWVPAHSFLPAIGGAGRPGAPTASPASSPSPSYATWLSLLAQHNMIMVRVWGGGIYEADAFYDTCNALGLLVWQDFAFACASYPADEPAFRASVAAEAAYQTARLHHHPALVCWAGNNEDYQMIEHYRLRYDVAHEKADPDPSRNPDAWLQTDFPARYLYEHLLPAAVRRHCPHVPYHPGSPFGTGASTTLAVDATVGDIHQWDVWNGKLRPYQQLPQMGGRFVSEFGMLALPHLATLRRCITAPGQLYAASPLMDARNKAIGHQGRLLKYLGDNYRLDGWGGVDDDDAADADNIDAPLARFVHLSQLVQADTMAYAYRAWRRDWHAAAARRCGGALVWQLNDCWPTASWAVADFFAVPKPALYAIRRALAPLAINVAPRAPDRVHDPTARPATDDQTDAAAADPARWQRPTGHVAPPLTARRHYTVWAASSLQQPSPGLRVVLRCVSVATGRDVQPPVTAVADVGPNGTTELMVGEAGPEERQKTDGAPSTATARLLSLDPCVLAVTLYDPAGLRLSRDTLWPEPFKYLDLSRRRVRVQWQLPAAATEGTVTVTAARPTKGFVFAEQPGGPRFSHNGFDIMPGEPEVVHLQRASAGQDWPKLEWMYAGM